MKQNTKTSIYTKENRTNNAAFIKINTVKESGGHPVFEIEFLLTLLGKTFDNEINPITDFYLTNVNLYLTRVGN